jgi:hypothetical protein
MAQVIRAIDLREPPPQYELANGTRIQIAYLDAAGWMLLEQYVADPGNLTALRAVVAAAAPGADMDAIDRYASEADIGHIIALAKGRSPDLIQALKNGLSGVVEAAAPPAPSTPDSNPTTTSRTSSAASRAPTGKPSARSGTSRGRKRSSLSTP